MQRWSLVNAAELSPQVCGKLAAQKKKTNRRKLFAAFLNRNSILMIYFHLFEAKGGGCFLLRGFN